MQIAARPGGEGGEGAGFPRCFLRKNLAQWKKATPDFQTFIKNYRDYRAFRKHSGQIVKLFTSFRVARTNQIILILLFLALSNVCVYYFWIEIHFENLHYKDFIIKLLLHRIHIHTRNPNGNLNFLFFRTCIHWRQPPRSGGIIFLRSACFSLFTTRERWCPVE